MSVVLFDDPALFCTNGPSPYYIPDGKNKTPQWVAEWGDIELEMEVPPGTWEFRARLPVNVSRPPGADPLKVTAAYVRLCYSEDGGATWHPLSGGYNTVTGHYSPYDGFVARIMQSIATHPSLRSMYCADVTLEFPAVTTTLPSTTFRLEGKVDGPVNYHNDAANQPTISEAVIAYGLNIQPYLRAIPR